MFTEMALRKVDALVAEHVMGWVVYFSDGEYVEKDGTPVRDWRYREGEESYRTWVPEFSTDIAAAWQIVESIQGSTQGTVARVVQQYDGVWTAHFEGFGDKRYDGRGHADTAPLAICLAALKAVGVEVEDPKYGVRDDTTLA